MTFDPDKIAELRPGIFYVDLGRISAADFKAAHGRIAAARGVVFDLREYPNAVKAFEACIEASRQLYALSETSRFEVEKRRAMCDARTASSS